MDGSLLVPPLPGGVFRTPSLANPVDRTWTVELTFPPAPEPTVAVVTVLRSGPVEVGLAIPGTKFVVGSSAPAGVLVLDRKQPVTGLSPSLTLTEPDGTTTTLSLRDDGYLPGSFDSLGGNGLYNAPVTFAQTGRHLVESTVAVPAAGAVVTREVRGFVDVMAASVVVEAVTGGVVTAPSGCVAELTAEGSLQVSAPLTVALTAQLESATDATNTLTRTASVTPALVNTSTPFRIAFDAEAIRDGLAGSGPYSLPLLVFESVSADGSVVEVVRTDVATFSSVLEEDLCRSAISVGSRLNSDLNVAGGFIESIDFRFPVRVESAGVYQISFKVTGAGGQDVQQFAVSEFLVAGENEIGVTVGADQFQTLDGPYRVESVLVLGQGASAQKSIVGATGPLSRFQFSPLTEGDLDADGDLDNADLALIQAARNTPALVPGDRRDLTGDGAINLRDARAFILLR